MKDPCIFSIIPAGPPQPPSSCSILNQTTDLLQVYTHQPLSSCSVLNQTTDLLQVLPSTIQIQINVFLGFVQVECIAGFDGGLDQTFLLELIDSKLDKVNHFN